MSRDEIDQQTDPKGREIGRLEGKIYSLEAELAESESECSWLDCQRGRLEEELRGARETIRSRLQAENERLRAVVNAAREIRHESPPGHDQYCVCDRCMSFAEFNDLLRRLDACETEGNDG